MVLLTCLRARGPAAPRAAARAHGEDAPGLDHFLISEKAYFEARRRRVRDRRRPGARRRAACCRALSGADARPRAVRARRGRHRGRARAGDPPARGRRRRAFTAGRAAEHGAALLERARATAGAVPVGMQTLRRCSAWRRACRWYGRDVDETVILPETRLDTLVSYTKGCYIGQEIVARVKYRGHINRGALAASCSRAIAVPAAGRAVMADGKEIGRVTSAVRSIALGPAHRARLRPARALRAGQRGRRSRIGDAARRRPRVAALPFVREPALRVTEHRHTNRLAGETSPYLLQHAPQPRRLVSVGRRRPSRARAARTSPCCSPSATPPATGAT